MIDESNKPVAAIFLAWAKWHFWTLTLILLVFCLVAVGFFFLYLIRTETLTAARLAHVDERRTTMREVGVQNPDRTHTQGLKITEENVLPLL